MNGWITLLWPLVLWLTACSTQPADNGNPASVQPSEPQQPPLVALLPAQTDGFTYVGFQRYSEPALGYSVRYQVSANSHADIYVYPVPVGANDYSHQQIVLGMATYALQEIERHPAYEALQVLEKKQYQRDGTVVVKVAASFLQDNLAAYTLLYLTEKSNLVIKARITMPDNPHNRDSKQWDRFVVRIFQLITDNIDKA